MTGIFAGRTAVVTGGGRGLGYAMAEALGRQGADLVLVDLLETVPVAAQRLAREVGVAAVGHRVDVTDADAVGQLFDQVDGPPDMLINAAGIAWNEAALTISPEKWRTILDVNVTGTFLMCQELARRLVSAGRGGVIVNVASMSGLIVNQPQPQAAYNTSKAAIAMLTASLAVEWLPYGIRVNAVAPGYFASDMTKAVSEREPEMVAEWLRRTPAGRMGEPPELGPLVVYLCSEDSRFVIGQSIVIDGGYTLV